MNTCSVYTDSAPVVLKLIDLHKWLFTALPARFTAGRYMRTVRSVRCKIMTVICYKASKRDVRAIARILRKVNPSRPTS